MKKIVMLLTIVLLVLTGCSKEQAGKTAKDHGSGISVQIEQQSNIKQISLSVYEGGIETFSEHVVNADSTSFSNGQVLWFDVSPPLPKSTSVVTVSLSYSENIDRTGEKTTNKIDISKAEQWVNLELDENQDLKLNELK